MKTFQEILNTINQQPAIPNHVPNLEKIQNAIKELFSDLEKYKSQMIVIAGTNGKGSVAKSLESLLLSSGESVCLYTSPHLLKINERIRYNAKNITDTDFTQHYQHIEPLIAKWKLSHFEILTLLALSYFTDPIKNGSRCIWEVGMGGRWDATNAIPHDYNILTTIGFDHQKYLGKELTEIAQNKFDIISSQSTVISGFLPTSCFSLLQDKIIQQSAKWQDLARDVDFQTTYLYQKTEQLADSILHNGQSYPLSLCGERGYQNTLLALYAYQHLGYKISEKTLRSLNTVYWPHRFSLLKNTVSPCPTYLSGDHNPEGILSLNNIIERLQYNKLWIITGITEGRDPNQIFTPLSQHPRVELILTQSPFKGLSLEYYHNHWKEWERLQPQEFHDACGAFQYVCAKASPQDVILITGSLYLTAQIDEVFGIREDNII